MNPVDRSLARLKPRGEEPDCPADEQDLLAIGRVLRTWGLKGDLRVASYAESPETFHGHSELYLRTADGLRKLTLERVREQGRAILCKFKGRDRVEEAEDLVGATLYVRKQDLRPLPEGEYYWYQLIGMEVWTEEGTCLGTLRQILNAGSRDIYVVSRGKREWLIPAIPEVIRKVDVPGARMTIHPIEGLLDQHDL